MGHYFEFNNVSYSKNNEHILTNVSFNIPRQGDTVAILGPSGIGKTTILKCISGVRKIVQGNIQLKENTA